MPDGPLEPHVRAQAALRLSAGSGPGLRGGAHETARRGSQVLGMPRVGEVRLSVEPWICAVAILPERTIVGLSPP